jgi:hypothetical protein
VQTISFDILHYHEDQVFLDIEVIYLDDIGVLQVGHSPSLSFETGYKISPFQQVAVKHFDGYLTPQMSMHALIDLSHPTPTDSFSDTIFADFLSD